MLSRSTLLAATLVVAFSATAFAQTASTAGDGQISPVLTPQDPGVPSVDHNPQIMGATGDARVPGDRSTMAGDRSATIEQRTGEIGANGGSD